MISDLLIIDWFSALHPVLNWTRLESKHQCNCPLQSLIAEDPSLPFLPPILSAVSQTKKGKAYNKPISFGLHDQLPPSTRNKLFKYFFKVFTDLLKRPFDSFIFTLIKSFNEFLNTLGGCIEFTTSFQEVVSFFGEIGILLKSFLVDVGEFLERFLHFMQFLDYLVYQRCPVWTGWRDVPCQDWHRRISYMPLLAGYQDLE